MKKYFFILIITILLTPTFAQCEENVKSSSGQFLMLDEPQKIFVSLGTSEGGLAHRLVLWQYDSTKKQIRFLGEINNAVGSPFIGDWRNEKAPMPNFNQ